MKIRNYRSCLSKEDCKAFKRSSIAVQPVNAPVCRDLSVNEVCHIGDQKMAEENFVLIKGKYDV